MTIQNQTVLSDVENGVYGNCLVTTYACYLDKKVDECPQFQFLFDCKEPEGFWDGVVDLWVKSQGYKRLHYMGDYDPFEKEGHDDYYFAWGMSPRGIMHQVIFYKGKLFHDPHPSGAGLVDIRGFEILKRLEHTAHGS